MPRRRQPKISYRTREFVRAQKPQALAILTNVQREVLRLRYLEERPAALQTIAEQLGISKQGCHHAEREGLRRLARLGGLREPWA